MSQRIVERNNVRVFGDGDQPMMFAHGFGCDQNMWRFITPAFEQDYRIVLFDYVGAGKSDIAAYDKVRYSRLDGYAQDVLEICQALDLEEVILVGHSVSSMIAVLAANLNPDRFSHLIMVGPFPRYINDPPEYFGGFERADIEGLLDMMDRNYIGWANSLGPAIVKNPERPELSEELTESFCSTDPQIARRFAEATFFADNIHPFDRGPLEHRRHGRIRSDSECRIPASRIRFSGHPLRSELRSLQRWRIERVSLSPCDP